MRLRRSILCLCPALVAASIATTEAPAQIPSSRPRAGTPSFPAPPNPLAPGRSALVRESPFGLSLEYPLLQRALGSGPCPPPALTATLRELGSPAIRVGGDSQDLAGPTPAYHYDVPAIFWTALGCLSRETGAQITVGLNFGVPNLQDEQTTIARAEQAIPAAQLTFSLGNEPDLYTIAHIIPNEPGFIVPSFRSAPWTSGRFFGQWGARRRQLGPVRLEGPDLAGTGWRAATESALRTDPPSQVDAHGYPTVAPCGKSGLSATAAHLLSIHASVGMAEKLSWLARLAHSIGRPAVISETNSASCGGRPGVSDARVSGVWAVRYVIAALLAGFEQVRFHSAGTSYDPLVFGADGSVTLRPLGKALLFLHRWLPVGSRVVSISRDPRVLAIEVTGSASVSTILSSFAAKPFRFTLPDGNRVLLSPGRVLALGIRGVAIPSHGSATSAGGRAIRPSGAA
ncbi:MAG TPA: hypothetical protein VHU13_01605 [Solirubrobacteraceae bacterium]|jgi:hypothetical protein|nr:hypothetical protein [Solirubrobacteraceae bacterium]